VLGFAPARHGTAPPPPQAEQRAKPGCSTNAGRGVGPGWPNRSHSPGFPSLALTLLESLSAGFSGCSSHRARLRAGLWLVRSTLERLGAPPHHYRQSGTRARPCWRPDLPPPAPLEQWNLARFGGHFLGREWKAPRSAPRCLRGAVARLASGECRPRRDDDRASGLTDDCRPLLGVGCWRRPAASHALPNCGSGTLFNLMGLSSLVGLPSYPLPS
jgi:hypothetical protein